MGKVDYGRQVLAMDDLELEKFVRDWAKSKENEYESVTRFTGAGDRGRDVVGFLSKAKHEGPWHNYQCKQYSKTLPTDTGICEIGKILYYAFKKEFTPPEKYFFVAPKGVNRNLEQLIFNPCKYKETLISEWDKYCSENIISGTKIPLDEPLKTFIEAYDFSRIERVNLDDILDDPSAKPVLFDWFSANPGPAPKGEVPKDISDSELAYIKKLIDAYSEREKKEFSSHEEIVGHPQFERHLKSQRERFYHADAFKRFYRDNTSASTIEDFEEDIYNGVIDKCESTHEDALTCINEVMSQAANIQPSGVLAEHARVPVKQGVCHHLANEDRLVWDN